MTDILEQIHRDHIHITRLLDRLEAELALFQRGEQPDYGLMLGIMQYMLNYPDLAHHYIEELIFKCLQDPVHDVPGHIRREMQQLAEQHNTLHMNGLIFADKLQSVVDGQSIVSRKEIESAARRYITLLREHMDREEADVLPEARRTLTEQEWRHIRAGLPAFEGGRRYRNRLIGFDTLYSYLAEG